MSPAPRYSRFGSLAARPPLAFPGQRVGVMGGSFNPPHAGHLIVAETALKRLRLDQVWWLVTPGNPLKDQRHLALQADRLQTVRAFATGPRMKATGFEQELGTRYTAETLGFLTRRDRRVRFVWVMGADNLASFSSWQSWRSIARTMPIAVVDRPGWRFRALSGCAGLTLARSRLPESRAAELPGMAPPAWVFLTTRLSKLSSTMLRNERATTILTDEVKD